MEIYFALGESPRSACRRAKAAHPDCVCIALNCDAYGQPVYVAYEDDVSTVIELCEARLVGLVNPRHAEIDAVTVEDNVKKLVTCGHKVLVMWGWAIYREDEFAQQEKEQSHG